MPEEVATGVEDDELDDDDVENVIIKPSSAPRIAVSMASSHTREKFARVGKYDTDDERDIDDDHAIDDEHDIDDEVYVTKQYGEKYCSGKYGDVDEHDIDEVYVPKQYVENDKYGEKYTREKYVEYDKYVENDKYGEKNVSQKTWHDKPRTWSRRGTKTRGGAAMQDRRKLLASSPDAATAIAKFWARKETYADLNLLRAAFGGAALQQWELDRG